MKLEDLKSTFESWIKQYEAEKVEFLSRLESDSNYAFEWSATIMSQSPRANLARWWLQSIKDREKDDAALPEGEQMSEVAMVEFIRSSTLKSLIQSARHPSHSSNVQKNYIYQQITSAYAELHDLLNRGW